MEPQQLFLYVQQSTASFMMWSGTPHGQTALHQCIINSMACPLSLGSCTGAALFHALSRVGSATCARSCNLRRQTANSRDIQWRSMLFACPDLTAWEAGRFFTHALCRAASCALALASSNAALSWRTVQECCETQHSCQAASVQKDSWQRRAKITL